MNTINEIFLKSLSRALDRKYVSIPGISRHGIVSLIVAFGLVFGASFSSYAASDDLAEMSLEELLNIEVTSVSKKAEKRTEAAAAIFVVTNDDIKRSGARNIPDVLRMVPGLSVSQLDAYKWSVSSRGFAGRFSNKLLVLIDGRSVYTPQFSGVYWEVQDVVFEDIDRIEVIRGPGGALWGANAVNGVINIVTKSAADTQGALLSIGGGTEDLAFTTVRYGGTIENDRGHYRVYGKFLARDTGSTATGADSDDGGSMAQGGFRVDSKLSLHDTLTIQGDVYENRSESEIISPTLTAALVSPTPVVTTPDVSRTGFNLLARWNREISDRSDLQLQVYFDHYEVENANARNTMYDTADVEFQHRIQLGNIHDVVWGLSARIWWDEHQQSTAIAYVPDSETNDILSAFFQDQLSLSEDLTLTLGTKVEHNSQTRWEVQPNVRLAWTPNENHTLWGAVSRAVRTPSRAEDDLIIVDSVLPIGVVSGTLPGIVALVGNRDFESEELIAYELGYRTNIKERVWVDIATFYNVYDNLRTLETGTPFAGPFPGLAPLAPYVAVPVHARNNLEAETYGVEITIDFKPRDWWRVRAFYALLKVDLDFAPGVVDAISAATDGDTPEQTAYLQNSFQLSPRLELDMVLRFIDQLPSIGVDNYIEADLRVGWHPKENLEIAVGGRNLLDNEHFEFAPRFVNSTPTQVERSVYGVLTWTF